MATDKLIKMQKDAGLQYPPTELTYQYRLAMQGEGECAYEWSDKPHRLICNLCSEIERAAAEQVRASEGVVEQATALVDFCRATRLGKIENNYDYDNSKTICVAMLVRALTANVGND